MRKKRDEFLYIRTLAFHTHLDIIKNMTLLRYSKILEKDGCYEEVL